LVVAEKLKRKLFRFLGLLKHNLDGVESLFSDKLIDDGNRKRYIPYIRETENGRADLSTGTSGQ
jgi:hypothetical protein